MTISVGQHRAATGYYQNFIATKKTPRGNRKRLSDDKLPESNIEYLDSKLFSIVNTRESCNDKYCNVKDNKISSIKSMLLLLSIFSQSRLPGAGSSLRNSSALQQLPAIPSCRGSLFVGHLAEVIYQGVESLGSFIAHYDPLKFPAADASSVPDNNRQPRDNRVIFFSQPTSEKLFSALSGWEPGMQIADKEIFPFVFVTPTVSAKSRASRRLLSEAISEQTAAEAEYIKNHCNIRTKTVYGSTVGDGLLVTAEYIRNPILAVYETALKAIAPAHEISNVESLVAEVTNVGVDLVAGYYTSGAAPIIKYSSAQVLKVAGHAINGDMQCVRNDFSPQELANLLFNTEVGLTNRGVIAEEKMSSIVTELDEMIPFQPSGIFIHEHMPSRINTEKYLLVKHDDKAFIIHDKGAGDYIAVEMGAVHADQRGIRVSFDETSNKIFFDSSMPAGQGLDYEVIDGKYFIDIYGKKCNFIYKKGDDLPQVVLEKINGETLFVPVYQSVVSGQWHMMVNNGHRVFSHKQEMIISHLSVPYLKKFNYKVQDNINPIFYGNGKIYCVSHASDVTDDALYNVVEMKNALLPVRITPTAKHGAHYEVYDINNQSHQGCAIEWDGMRWIFENPTSPFVSTSLKEHITSAAYARDVDISKLSHPDRRGLKWDAQDQAYLKINNHYVRITKIDDYKYKVMGEGDIGYLHFKNKKFYGETFLERLEVILNGGLSGRGGRWSLPDAMLPYDKNCVAMALSKVFRVNMFHTIEKLRVTGAISSATELENTHAIITVMQRVDMPKVMSNAAYSEMKHLVNGLPNGRYFAINSKAHPFEENKEAHAFAVILKDGSMGISGNNAESPGRSYNSVLTDNDQISMWGPYPD